MDRHDWVLGVLADISEFAGENNLPKLQAMAEDAKAVAEVEIGEVQAEHHKAIMKAVLASAPQSAQSQSPSPASVQDNPNYVRRPITH